MKEIEFEPELGALLVVLVSAKSTRIFVLARLSDGLV